MAAFLGKRLLLLIPVVFGVVTLTFFLMHMTPGDPARTFLGTRASPEALEALRHQWGLDQPLWNQFLNYLGELARGDLGESTLFREPIINLLAIRLPPTLALLFMSTVFSIIIALPLAAWAAVKKNTWVDGVVRFFSAIVLGMPTFFIGAIFIAVFALQLGLFPVGGYGSSFLENVWSLVLPSITVALGIVPLLVRSLRASLIDSLDSEYVSFATTKGLKRTTVWVGYALRNGSISGVTILGIQVGILAGGSLVVENVFAIPGMGSFLMQGILNRDFPVVQASTLTFALLVVVVYLLTDVTYALLDPRVRQK